MFKLTDGNASNDEGNDVIIHLPFPLSSRKYYIKGRILSKAAREYRLAVAECLIEQNLVLSIQDSVEFTVVLFVPDRRRRDLDNYMKSLQDALTHAGLWDDDSLINHLDVYRGEVIKGGSCVIRLRSAPPIITYADIDTFMAR